MTIIQSRRFFPGLTEEDETPEERIRRVHAQFESPLVEIFGPGADTQQEQVEVDLCPDCASAGQHRLISAGFQLPAAANAAQVQADFNKPNLLQLFNPIEIVKIISIEIMEEGGTSDGRIAQATIGNPENNENQTEIFHQTAAPMPASLISAMTGSSASQPFDGPCVTLGHGLIMTLLMDNLDAVNPKNFIVAMLLKRTGCKKKKRPMNPGLFDIRNHGLGKRRPKPKPRIVLLPASLIKEARRSALDWIEEYRSCYRVFISRQIVAHSLGQAESSKDPRIEKIFQSLRAQKKKWWAMQRAKKAAKKRERAAQLRATAIRRKKASSTPNTKGPKRPKKKISKEAAEAIRKLEQVKQRLIFLINKSILGDRRTGVEQEAAKLIAKMESIILLLTILLRGWGGDPAKITPNIIRTLERLDPIVQHAGLGKPLKVEALAIAFEERDETLLTQFSEFQGIITTGSTGPLPGKAPSPIPKMPIGPGVKKKSKQP